MAEHWVALTPYGVATTQSTAYKAALLKLAVQYGLTSTVRRQFGPEPFTADISLFQELRPHGVGDDLSGRTLGKQESYH